MFRNSAKNGHKKLARNYNCSLCTSECFNAACSFSAVNWHSIHSKVRICLTPPLFPLQLVPTILITVPSVARFSCMYFNSKSWRHLFTTSCGTQLRVTLQVWIPWIYTVTLIFIAVNGHFYLLIILMPFHFHKTCLRQSRGTDDIQDFRIVIVVVHKFVLPHTISNPVYLCIRGYSCRFAAKNKCFLYWIFYSPVKG